MGIHIKIEDMQCGTHAEIMNCAVKHLHENERSSNLASSCSPLYANQEPKGDKHGEGIPSSINNEVKKSGMKAGAKKSWSSTRRCAIDAGEVPGTIR
eukprot:scaffold176832_cov35-Tisochrysis_lutea.AAC.2